MEGIRSDGPRIHKEHQRTPAERLREAAIRLRRELLKGAVQCFSCEHRRPRAPSLEHANRKAGQEQALGVQASKGLNSGHEDLRGKPPCVIPARQSSMGGRASAHVEAAELAAEQAVCASHDLSRAESGRPQGWPVCSSSSVMEEAQECPPSRVVTRTIFRGQV